MKNIILAGFFLAVCAAGAGAEPAPCECDRCIAAYGDSRTGDAEHKKIVALIEAARPLAVFHTGDLVPKGDDTDGWRNFRDITKDLRASASFYAVLGNHELKGEKFFADLFRNPGNGRWYREDLRGIRFIMLDYLSPLEKGSEQYKWLEKELQAPAGVNKFKVIVMHKPLMSTGRHGHEKWKAAAGLEKLFKERGVDLVLAGHDHDYERLEKDGLVHLVAGGGGAPLRRQYYKNPASKIFASVHHYCLLSVCGEVLKGEVFDIENKLIDSFEIHAKKTPAPKAGN
ncbi:MAG: metallophosphoesterase [Elusimicrobiales bacterium]|nr:metallophosphoesterase [Elusimicrobiales bacterium]